MSELKTTTSEENKVILETGYRILNNSKNESSTLNHEDIRLEHKVT